MNDIQKAYILNQLPQMPHQQRLDFVESQLHFFGLAKQEIKVSTREVMDEFENGLGTLLEKQFSTLKDRFNVAKNNHESLKIMLDHFEVNESSQKLILQFFDSLQKSQKEVDIIDLDDSFSGIQVVTDGDFNTILNQGWSGEWVVELGKIKSRGITRIQIASMKDNGPFPRGFYINADIVNIVPTPNMDGRYRFHFSNPQIINSGNRNVKFNQNPVRYID